MINIGTVYTEINRAEAEGLFEEAESRIYAAGEYGREGGRGNKKETPVVMSSEGFTVRKLIAERVGVGEQVVQRALTIKRKRPDLYLRIFNGYDDNGKEVKIGTVYAQMKRDEADAAGSFIRDDCGCSGYTIPHRLTPSAGRGKAPRPSLSSSSFAA
ncbi:hypothetical protein M4D57_20300 [Brevibacillus borstelensis]|uniref:hypothetical protein n=1 Tax=Brevibacillus borstelensis TaxID=45462 RepID=UPI00203DDB80|nr:hypothetical protein [Brevibacillus borstelensis]MCM3560909.1 hypothetical protein [Brevibacillus borstelensis]